MLPRFHYEGGILSSNASATSERVVAKCQRDCSDDADLPQCTGIGDQSCLHTQVPCQVAIVPNRHKPLRRKVQPLFSLGMVLFPPAPDATCCVCPNQGTHFLAHLAPASGLDDGISKTSEMATRNPASPSRDFPRALLKREKHDRMPLRTIQKENPGWDELPFMRVLDLGCGSRRELASWGVTASDKVTGLNIDDSRLAVAKLRFSHRTHLQGFGRTPAVRGWMFRLRDLLLTSGT